MPLTRLTLFVPKLFPPEVEHGALDGLACPALAALLARGRFSRRPQEAPEAVLAGLFGHAADVALGALRLRGESNPPPDMAADWIAADPAHLFFQQDRLILVGGARLAIAPEESAAFIDALNDYFADRGVFYAASPERWYLRPAGAGKSALERLAAPPLSAVAGRGVEKQLAEVLDEREIGRLLNEIQTFLHSHARNREREKNGLPPINSLWLWGAGTPPSPASAANFDAVWSNDDALCRGLARAAGIPSHPLGDGLPHLLALAAGAKRPLAVLADLAALEARWFAPAWRALKTGAIERIILVAPTVHGTLTWDAGRAAPWRLWRRQTLAETARTLGAANEATA